MTISLLLGGDFASLFFNAPSDHVAAALAFCKGLATSSSLGAGGLELVVLII